MMLCCLETLKKVIKYLNRGVKKEKTPSQAGGPIQLEFESLPRSLGAACTKMKAQDTYMDSVFNDPHMHGKIIS